MSYTELIPFKGGLPQDGIHFSNSWGGVARIWDALFTTYIPKKHEYDSWVSGDQQRLWDLANDLRLRASERACHVFTFDNFYVRKENFPRFIADLHDFVRQHPYGGRVDHLPAFADWIESNPDVEAVGIYGTSVSNNPWIRQKKCDSCHQSVDETEPIPLSEGHEVYDWMDANTPNT